MIFPSLIIRISDFSFFSLFPSLVIILFQFFAAMSPSLWISLSTNRFHLLIYLSFCFLLCPYVSAFLSLTLSSSLSLSLSLFIYLSLSHSSSLFIYPPRSLCSLTLSHFYFHPLLSTSSTTHRYTTAFPPIWLAAAASLGFFHPDLPAITAAMATINSLYSYSVRKVLYFLPNVNFITAIFAFFLPFF